MSLMTDFEVEIATGIPTCDLHEEVGGIPGIQFKMNDGKWVVERENVVAWLATLPIVSPEDARRRLSWE